VLALALLMPLAVMGLAVAQVPGINVGLPSSVVYADASRELVTHRPASSSTAPPPTLAPPTATPVPPTPTAAPVATAAPTTAPTQGTARSYTVQRGDELKNIAAQYHVSIWSIVAVNDIPNPDSLRVGQVLSIPTT
jgi:LysM repeat protein